VTSVGGSAGRIVRAGRLPDFFIVGHAKSGTTALYEMLARHPQIFMPQSKEPWFMADELLERTPPRPEGTARTLSDYEALFAGARPGQVVGEASALYLWSPTAAARIAELAPEARIVVILREPASFLRSLHMQFVESYVETQADLRQALALEPARRRGEQVPRHTYWPKTLLYSEHTRYVELLRRYHERFAAERVLVLIYDDFRADNEGTVKQVFRFLGVDDGVEVRPREANPTVQMRSGAAHRALHAISVGHGPGSRALKRTLKAVLPRQARKRLVRTTKQRFVQVEPSPPDEQLMAELRGQLKGEVQALSEYLNRDLVRLWGYDGVE
jgi:Sulfotransferase domain